MAGPPSSPNQPRISVQLTDKDVIAKIAMLFGVRYFQCCKPKKKHWKTSFGVQLKGTGAVNLMRQLHPLMGQRRQEQIKQALVSYTPRGVGDNSRKLTVKDVRAIRQALKKPGVKILRLAAKYNVSRPTIRDIRNGRLWKWLR